MSGNIRTLWGNKDGKDKDDKQPKKVEEFSVGGAASSTAVLRPVRGADGTVGGGGAAAAGGRPGGLINDIVDGARNGGGPGQHDGPAIGQITLFKNGFKVGEGEFRPTADPKNEAFLRELKKGEVPRELEQDLVLQYGPDVESVGVSLVDKSSEDYVPPKEKFSFAKSQGHSMVSGAESKSAGTGAGAGSFANAPAAEYHADKSKPTANIQIVLHPRQRVTAVFNLDATVLQLYQHIKHLSSAPSFSMLAGFPPVALTDGSKTIAEAKLAGASVQQKL